MAQNRVDLADALIKDLEYVFEEHKISVTGESIPVTYRQRVGLIDKGSGPGGMQVFSTAIVIAPVTVIPDDVEVDNLVVAYNFADVGAYTESTYFGEGNSSHPIRSMGVDIAVGSKEYGHILAAGDWLIDYFDGKDITLGTQAGYEVADDATFKTIEITFDGETQPDMITEGDRVITASYNFNIIYDRGQ